MATEQDLPRILQLIEYGRQKMRMMGNIEQWSDGNPKRELLVEDISRGDSYVVEEGGVAVATFAFIEGPDITYDNIYGGKWVDDMRPYFVVHRMASMLGVHGVFNDVLDGAERLAYQKTTITSYI